MGRELKYFMWGYQEYFRHFLVRRADEAFKALGVNTSTRALLVGIRAEDKNDRYPVCISPEDEDFDPQEFQCCYERSVEIEKDHPNHKIFYGDEASMRDKPENILRSSIRESVDEFLSSYDFKKKTKHVCGSATKVDDYYVVPVLLIDRETFDTIPSLPNRIRLESIGISCLNIGEALMVRLLDEASQGLKEKDPGRSRLEANPCSVEELLIQAADLFCSAISYAVQDFMLQDVFASLNKASSILYEGNSSVGAIVFAPGYSDALQKQVIFSNPIRLHTSKFARKIIEMSDETLLCVCDSDEGISSLATLESSKNLFRAVFKGHYCWDLLYGETLLMQCSYGVPKLPKTRLSKDAFISNIRRSLEITIQQADKIWHLVSQSMEQKHGTMLVVSTDAKNEAQRLSTQSLSIAPIEITPEFILNISSIDGSILIDQDCTCHAIGVILDGMASDMGDPSRGARYNAAIKYVTSIDAPTICLVISEDGYVNMIPELHPQIDRDLVEERVSSLKKLNPDNYGKTRHWLDKHRFYLTEEQCERVNEELDRIDSETPQDGRITFKIPHFSPNPEMDESYYTDFFDALQ